MKELTLDNIINLLQISGSNSKSKVLKALKEATVEDLMMLRESITEKINVIRIKNND